MYSIPHSRTCINGHLGGELLKLVHTESNAAVLSNQSVLLSEYNVSAGWISPSILLVWVEESICVFSIHPAWIYSGYSLRNKVFILFSHSPLVIEGKYPSSLPHFPHILWCPGVQFSPLSVAVPPFCATSYSTDAKRITNLSWLIDFLKDFSMDLILRSSRWRRHVSEQLAGKIKIKNIWQGTAPFKLKPLYVTQQMNHVWTPNKP